MATSDCWIWTSVILSRLCTQGIIGQAALRVSCDRSTPQRVQRQKQYVAACHDLP